MPSVYFTVWTWKNCPYCVRAKALLKRKGLAYKEVPLTSENADEFKRVTGGAKTVPQVFYHEGERTKHVGGYDDLEKFAEAWWPDL